MLEGLVWLPKWPHALPGPPNPSHPFRVPGITFLDITLVYSLLSSKIQRSSLRWLGSTFLLLALKGPLAPGPFQACVSRYAPADWLFSSVPALGVWFTVCLSQSLLSPGTLTSLPDTLPGLSSPGAFFHMTSLHSPFLGVALSVGAGWLLHAYPIHSGSCLSLSGFSLSLSLPGFCLSLTQGPISFSLSYLSPCQGSRSLSLCLSLWVLCHTESCLSQGLRR